MKHKQAIFPSNQSDKRKKITDEITDRDDVRGDAKKRHDVTADDDSAQANLCKYIDDNLVGQKTTFRGPFGRKRVVYCDNSKTGLRSVSRTLLLLPWSMVMIIVGPMYYP